MPAARHAGFATLVWVAVCVGALAMPAGAGADDSFSASAGDLAARGSLFVWDQSEGSGPLMAGFGSAASPLPVAAATFGDLALGTDARGRTVALYSACRRERVRPSCRLLYLYRFGHRGERRLSVAPRGCTEGSARISRGVIVFAGSCARPGSRRARRPVLYVKRPGRPARLLRGVPRLTEEVLQRRGLTSFDLSGNTLAFSERRVSNELPEGSTWHVVTEVRVLRLGRRHSRLLARATKLESPTSTGVSLDNVRLDVGFAYWQRGIVGLDSQSVELPVRQDILRRPIDGSAPAAQLERTGRLYVTGADDALGNYAVSGDRLYYSGPGVWGGPTGPASFIARVDGTPVFR